MQGETVKFIMNMLV